MSSRIMIAVTLAVAACDSGTSASGPDGGTTNDPRSGFVGKWAPQNLHHWEYTCGDGTGGGYDRAQTGFFWQIALATADRIALSIHDPQFPTCNNGAGTCEHDYTVSGNTATAVQVDASSVVGTYVLSSDAAHLTEDIKYDEATNGVICHWRETDTLVPMP